MHDQNDSPSRRTLLRGATWAVPTAAAAATAPALAASPPQQVRGITVEGQCGLAGLVGRGFTVEAGPDPIPAGTTIVVTDNGVLNVGLINLSRPELADLTLLGRGRVAVTLSSELGAGQSLAITWAVTVSIAYRADAVLTLPAGFEPGPGSKTSGFFQVPLLAGCFDG